MREDVGNHFIDKSFQQDMVSSHAYHNNSLEDIQLKFQLGRLKEAGRQLNTFLFNKDRQNRILPYFDAFNILILVYKEMGDQEAFYNLQSFFKQECEVLPEIEKTFEFNFYVGSCNYYIRDYQKALYFFQEALNIALERNNRNHLCRLSFCLAQTYKALKQNEKALEELNNLSVFFQVMPLFDLEMQGIILKSNIFKHQQNFSLALNTLLCAFDKLRKEKNYYFLAHFLFELGLTHKGIGETKKALSYFHSLNYIIDEENFPYLFKKTKDNLNLLSPYEQKEGYDIILNISHHKITEKIKGEIDFKNQYMLFNVLKLFILNPNKVFSKKELTEKIWKEEYNSKSHDNKIYVTIKRLREILETKDTCSRYIFRSKGGYHLNLDLKILVQ